MNVIHLILLILAGVLFGVDAFVNKTVTRLTAFGLLALVASMVSW
jgi:hypothetical protein